MQAAKRAAQQVSKKKPHGLAAPWGEPIVKWEGENAINDFNINLDCAGDFYLYICLLPFTFTRGDGY